jgi:hypothetical protein
MRLQRRALLNPVVNLDSKNCKPTDSTRKRNKCTYKQQVNLHWRVVHAHAHTPPACRHHPTRTTIKKAESLSRVSSCCRFALLALHFLALWACLHRFIVRSAPPYERTGKPERSTWRAHSRRWCDGKYALLESLVPRSYLESASIMYQIAFRSVYLHSCD